MRPLLAAALLFVCSCVATQFAHKCPASCGTGQVCDATVGMCKDDPCSGRCRPTQRCKAGPVPRCVDINVGENEENGPAEPSAPQEPPSPRKPPLMRAAALLLALAACVSATPYHSCPNPCGSGRACDTSLGECHDDPCEGRCARGERCEAGPPARCAIVPLSEMDISRPDNSPNSGLLH